MSNVQKTLDSLQPHVYSIRYVEGVPVVDAVFKDGWTLPEDSKIKKIKGDDGLNYYMIFSEVEGVGLDDLLTYVAKTIHLNQDREKKHELLRIKVNELKEVFKKNSLTKLTRLKFIFGEEDMVPNINDLDIEDKEEEIKPPVNQEALIETPEEEDIIDPVETPKAPETYLDENKKPIELSEEDREILEEEARAERNRKALENKKQNTVTKTPVNKIELPPKHKIQLAATRDYDAECECGPNDACSKCIDKKDL